MLEGETLAHYGIKNQKWGVRRFQNEDGSLTPEGRERYGLKGGLSSMSDEDLRKAINRKTNENTYIRLQTKDATKRRTDISEFVKALGDTTKTATNPNLQKVYLSGLNKSIAEDNARLQAQKEAALKSGDKKTADEVSKIIAQNNKDKATIQNAINVTGKTAEEVGKQSTVVGKVLTTKEMQDAKDRAYRNIGEMDEKQLKSVVDRMLLEEQYQNLVNPPKPSKLEKGKEWLQTVGSILGIALSAITIASAIKGIKSGDSAKHGEELTDEYLAHYGVKGMKKGIRRWTNEDGTLTEAGKEHYGLISKGRAQRDLRYANRMNIGRELLTEYHKYKKEEYENKGKEKKVNKENEKLKNLGELSKGGENFVKDLMKLRKDIKFSNKDKIIENYTVAANIGSLFVNDAIRARVVYSEDGRKTTLGNIRLAKQTNVTIPIITPFAIGVAGFTKTKDKKVLRQQEDSDDYLMHYGVKGMKKGDRRWQNEDGSLTAEGYIHYGINRRDPNARVQEVKEDYRVKKEQIKSANRLSQLQNKQTIKEQRALNKEEQRAQKVADKEEIKVRREQIETRRKNIMKAIVGTAAVAGIAALGYNYLHQKNLDNQMLRDLEIKKQEGAQILKQLNIEKKAEITVAKAKMMEAKGNVLEKLQSNSGTVIISEGKVQYAVNQAEKGKAVIKNVNRQTWWQKIKQYLS
jgi:hypothetical protein